VSTISPGLSLLHENSEVSLPYQLLLQKLQILSFLAKYSLDSNSLHNSFGSLLCLSIANLVHSPIVPSLTPTASTESSTHTIFSALFSDTTVPLISLLTSSFTNLFYLSVSAPTPLLLSTLSLLVLVIPSSWTYSSRTFSSSGLSFLPHSTYCSPFVKFAVPFSKQIFLLLYILFISQSNNL